MNAVMRLTYVICAFFVTIVATAANCNLVLDEVVTGNGDYVFKQSIRLNSLDPKEIDTARLSYRDRNLRVTVNLLADSGACSGFDYRLESFTSQWAHSDANQTVLVLSNIPAGEYALLFKMRGSGNNLQFRLPISIPTPFWLSWWFILTVSVSFLMAVSFFVSVFFKKYKLNTSVDEINVQHKTKNSQQVTNELARDKDEFFEQRNLAKSQASQISEQKEELERQRLELQRLVREQSNDLAQVKKLMAEKSKEMQISESKYQMLAENSRDMIFRMKLPEDVMEFISPASKDLTGYAPDEFYQNPGLFRKLIAKESREKYIDARRRILSGESIPSLEYKIVTNSGVEKWVSQRNVTVKGKNGEIEALEAIVFDVTSKKKDEVAMKAAKVRAEESDKLKTAFLSSMSHEIRTPMNAIVGFADLLKDPNVSTDDRHQYVEYINENSSSLLRLIDDMVDIARLEAGELDIVKLPVDIDSLCHDVYDDFKHRVDEFPSLSSIDFVLDVPADVRGLIVNSDRNRLNQILANLVSNALKFTDSGFVHLGVKPDTTSSGFIEFYVSDSGRGIPAEKQVEVFDRYRYVRGNMNKKINGTGLGLAISRSLVELLGGRLDVESQTGKGTVFTFSLPCENANRESPVVPVPIVPDSDVVDWSQKHILVAEDEDNNFKFMQAALKKTNVSLIRAKDGQEALELFREMQHLIDIVLMDIQMPKMNGYDATRELLKIDPDIPVVAQTAFAMSGGKIKCFDAGCIGYISKPYKAKDLIDVIAKHIK